MSSLFWRKLERFGIKTNVQILVAFSFFMNIVLLFILNTQPSNIEQRILEFYNTSSLNSQPRKGNSLILEGENKAIYQYDKLHPFIFIGGHPRSGTTLMRAILDTHSMVRCGEETRVIPRILFMRQRWEFAPYEKNRLLQAGITMDLLDKVVGDFIFEIVAKHGPPAKRLCNKDPITLTSGVFMNKVFPNAKWLFMVRDPRAVIYSMRARDVKIFGYNMKNPIQMFIKWNKMVRRMKSQCSDLGASRCMIIHYEQLILHPRDGIDKIVTFLDLPWEDSLMHHHDYISKSGDKGIRVSANEKSSTQIVNPINTQPLTSWFGNYTEKLLSRLPQIAPMMGVLGYDPEDWTPNYGQADPDVAKASQDLEQRKDFWSSRAEQLVKDMVKH